MDKKRGRVAAVSALRPADILHDIDAQPVVFDGTTISKREAHIRIVFARALKGSSRASKQLQKIRDLCGVDQVGSRVGCLFVPEPPSLEEFERMAHEQQRQFRENPCPEEFP